MHTQTSFSFSEVFHQGWATFKKHWKFIVPAIIATAILNIVLQLIQNKVNIDGGLIAFFVNILFIFIGLLITLGWAKVILQLNRSDFGGWKNFKTKPTIWWLFIKTLVWYLIYFFGYIIITTVIFIILTIVGMITDVYWLFITAAILGSIAFLLTIIYFGVRYQFIKYVVLDNPEMSSRELFKKAGTLTKKHLFLLLGFGIVMGLVNLIGLICLVVGLAVTIPVTKFAHARVYDYLKNN